MSGLRTYVDADVLIAAFRGEALVQARARALLTDPTRLLIGSVYLRLETVPKATYFGNAAELAVYERFFEGVSVWVAASAELAEQACALAGRYGLAAMDALHLAAALSGGAEEFLTTERPDRPLYRAEREGVRCVCVI